MQVRCVNCKNLFERKWSERKCGCQKGKRYQNNKASQQRQYAKNKLDGFFPYILTLRRNFQNAIYQYRKLI